MFYNDEVLKTNKFVAAFILQKLFILLLLYTLIIFMEFLKDSWVIRVLSRVKVFGYTYVVNHFTSRSNLRRLLQDITFMFAWLV